MRNEIYVLAMVAATTAFSANADAAAQFPTGTPRQGSAVTQLFGAGTGHLGTDFRAPENTPVYAMDDGIVTYSGWAGAAWGNVVIISHPSGVCSLYGHVNPGVVKGQRILRGQQIATVGPRAATSNAAHLHFECRRGLDAATTPGPGYSGQGFNRANNPTKNVNNYNITWLDPLAYLQANLIAVDRTPPSVRIINPQAGNFRFGQRVQLTFENRDANGISHVWIELYKGQQRVGYLRQAPPFSGDFASGIWTVPNSLPPGRDYRLKVISWDNSPEHNYTGVFSATFAIGP